MKLNTSAEYTTNSSQDHVRLACVLTKEADPPANLWVGKRKFWVPTLGESPHEEVVEIASHLGELPLAPFPALAHLDAAVVEVMIVVLVG